MLTFLLTVVLFLALVFLIPLALFKIKLARGIKRQQKQHAAFQAPELDTSPGVSSLTVLPLVEFHAAEPGLATEAGVSYLVTAGDTRILLDVGANEKGEHPSPLLANAKALGVDLNTIDALVLSHLHRDHVGGVPEEKEKRFSFSQGPFSMADLPVYTPEPLTGHLPQGCRPITVTEPREIAPGVWSLGPMGRSLFFMGYIEEQALAVHVKGKGMALIIGCGHPTIEGLLERCAALFPHPVFAVIGGLHFPIHEGRIKVGPVNIQKLVGSDRMPWNGLTEADVQKGIEAIKTTGATAVGLSPHDSCDWSLDRFRDAFGEAYTEVQVGRPITLAGHP
ncbi:MBL fold metallo-hydrolase [Desulfoluna spongiiphila]|uniref:MBL fold metallo-hydrolase n=1 Tax=Desulfoluna spongiiphila TaxID=419481 RepID=UPI001259EC0F|nr:MBL fold metallo-hydrolase [Desulfoluna spongiiphila]VVS93278.1 metallo-beta-lactamase [Desulfoluna spongiiphila]